MIAKTILAHVVARWRRLHFRFTSRIQGKKGKRHAAQEKGEGSARRKGKGEGRRERNKTITCLDSRHQPPIFPGTLPV